MEELKNVLTAEQINELVKNEMAMIDFNYNIFKNEDTELLNSIIGNSVDLIGSLVNHINVSMETLEELRKSTYPPLADYALVKIAIRKYDNK